MFFCSMCKFIAVNCHDGNRHITRYRNDANFIVNCCIEGCQYVSKSWNAYKVHVSRVHRDIPDVDEADRDDHAQAGAIDAQFKSLIKQKNIILIS